VQGTPTMLEAGGADFWFLPIVAALFGSYDVATDRRMIQEVFLLVPKKNAKSTNSALVMVTAIVMNRRPEAELVLIAPTKEIADISYSQAAGSIRLDEELSKLFYAQRHQRTLTHRQSGATLKIKAADVDVITGGKQVATLVDETHVFAAKAAAAEIFVEIRGALAARPDGFMMQITTQSKDAPAGVFLQELRTARNVRDGKLDLPLLPVLYELPEEIAADGGWKRRENWRRVNPNMGRSVDEAFLERELRRAEENGLEQLQLIASQHFNVEIGLSLRGDRWVAADYWEDAARPEIADLDKMLARCELAIAGIDGGGLDDLLALCVMGRDRETRQWLAWHMTWCQRDVLQLRKSEAARLLDFERAGELRIVDDLQTAYVQLADLVRRVDDAGLLPLEEAVGLDAMGVGLIVTALAEAGIYGEQRVRGVRQGWELNGAIKSTEVKVANDGLLHGGQAITAWAMGNVKIEPKGNAITITKQIVGRAKIDPVLATVMASAVIVRHPFGGYRGLYSADAAPAEDADDKAGEDDSAWDPAVLENMAHPFFAEHKARFERWQDNQVEDRW
jgi:phage terminase large subunit-like protein